MSYSLPDFNLAIAVWYAPRTPASGAPDFEGEGQKYYNAKPVVLRDPATGAFTGYAMELRVPQRTTIHQGDTVRTQPGEIHGDERDYMVVFRDRMHEGFTNSYDFWLCLPLFTT